MDAAQRATRERVEASHLLDAQRWTLSYREHSASALRRRVLAATNGRAK